MGSWTSDTEWVTSNKGNCCRNGLNEGYLVTEQCAWNFCIGHNVFCKKIQRLNIKIFCSKQPSLNEIWVEINEP